MRSSLQPFSVALAVCALPIHAGDLQLHAPHARVAAATETACAPLYSELSAAGIDEIALASASDGPLRSAVSEFIFNERNRLAKSKDLVAAEFLQAFSDGKIVEGDPRLNKYGNLLREIKVRSNSDESYRNSLQYIESLKAKFSEGGDPSAIDHVEQLRDAEKPGLLERWEIARNSAKNPSSQWLADADLIKDPGERLVYIGTQVKNRPSFSLAEAIEIASRIRGPEQEKLLETLRKKVFDDWTHYSPEARLLLMASLGDSSLALLKTGSQKVFDSAFTQAVLEGPAWRIPLLSRIDSVDKASILAAMAKRAGHDDAAVEGLHQMLQSQSGSMKAHEEIEAFAASHADSGLGDWLRRRGSEGADLASELGRKTLRRNAIAEFLHDFRAKFGQKTRTDSELNTLHRIAVGELDAVDSAEAKRLEALIRDIECRSAFATRASSEFLHHQTCQRLRLRGYDPTAPQSIADLFGEKTAGPKLADIVRAGDLGMMQKVSQALSRERIPTEKMKAFFKILPSLPSLSLAEALQIVSQFRGPVDELRVAKALREKIFNQANVYRRQEYLDLSASLDAPWEVQHALNAHPVLADLVKGTQKTVDYNSFEKLYPQAPPFHYAYSASFADLNLSQGEHIFRLHDEDGSMEIVIGTAEVSGSSTLRIHSGTDVRDVQIKRIHMFTKDPL